MIRRLPPLLLPLAAAAAWAQSYPAKAIRPVVPFVPGRDREGALRLARRSAAGIKVE